MPRGGRQAPDAYSPHKTADGRELQLAKSTKSSTGYYRVVKVHGKFWAKLKLDDVKGSRSQKLFGKDGKGEGSRLANVQAFGSVPSDLQSTRSHVVFGSAAEAGTAGALEETCVAATVQKPEHAGAHATNGPRDHERQEPGPP